MKEYNFVIYTDGFNALGDIFFKEVANDKNVIIINKSKIGKNSFLNKLFKFHFSFLINNRINLPFKKIWFPILNPSFHNENPTVYVFLSSWYYPEYFNFLKKQDSRNKIAYYFGDTVLSKSKNIKNFSMNFLKNELDYIGSYNMEDVNQFQLDYLPMCYSKIDDFTLLPKTDSYEIIFIGASRNRMDLIVEAYEQVVKSGASYFFYVVNSNGENVYFNDTNFVLTNTIMEYEVYLSYIKNSKVVLEIVDKDTSGGTLRFWDAVMYDKALVTNNREVIQLPFYQTGNIVYTESFREVDFHNILKNHNFSYQYIDENSPRKFLTHIINKLSSVEQEEKQK